MRKILLISASVAALLFSSNTKAETLVLTVNQGSNGASVNHEITPELEIKFMESQFSVVNGASASEYKYADVESITIAQSSGLSETTVAGSAYTLATNPVADMLRINGFTGSEGVRLSLASLSGATVVSLPNWQGQEIRVADLAPGLYILSIDSQTLKVIKK